MTLCDQLHHQSLYHFLDNVLLEHGGLPHVPPPEMTWETFLTLRAGIWTMYSHSDPLKVIGGVMGWVAVVVAHKILFTSQRPNFPLVFLN